MQAEQGLGLGATPGALPPAAAPVHRPLLADLHRLAVGGLWHTGANAGGGARGPGLDTRGCAPGVVGPCHVSVGPRHMAGARRGSTSSTLCAPRPVGAALPRSRPLRRPTANHQCALHARSCPPPRVFIAFAAPSSSRSQRPHRPPAAFLVYVTRLPTLQRPPSPQTKRSNIFFGPFR